jgi:hypothetical protein
MISPSISGGNIRGGSIRGGEELDGGARGRKRKCPVGWKRSHSKNPEYKNRCVKTVRGVRVYGREVSHHGYHLRTHKGRSARHVSSRLRSLFKGGDNQ